MCRVFLALALLMGSARSELVPLEPELDGRGMPIPSAFEWQGSDCDARPYLVVTPCGNISQLYLRWAVFLSAACGE